MKMLILVLSFCVSAADMGGDVGGWNFNEKNPANALLPVKDENFKGSWVKRNSHLTLLEYDAAPLVSGASLDDLKNAINLYYFKSAGQLVSERSISKGVKFKHLLIYKFKDSDGVQMIPFYVLEHRGVTKLITAQSAFFETAEDQKEIEALIRAL